MDANEAQKAIDRITGGMTDKDREAMMNADFPQMITFMSSQVMEMMQSGDLNKSISMITEALKDPNSTGDFLQNLLPPMPPIRENIKADAPRAPGFERVKAIKQPRIDLETSSDIDGEEIKPKTPNLCYTINIPLKVFYLGTKKKVKIVRSSYRRRDDGSIETFEEKKKLLIPIAPGARHGDQIIFPGESNNIPDHLPGDVVIKLSEDPDDSELFERKGDNLYIFRNISVKENYRLSQNITHLDGRVLTLKQIEGDHSIVHHGEGVRKVVGEGMPIKGTDKKGDLYVEFNLVLPKTLTKEKVDLLAEVFDTPSSDPPVEDSNPEGSGARGASDAPKGVVVELQHISESDLDFLADSWSESEYSDSDSDSESDSETASESDYSDSDPRLEKPVSHLEEDYNESDTAETEQ